MNPEPHIWWLMSRSLGVVATVLVAASVTTGMALSARISRRPGMPARFKRFHEALALTALGAILAHGLALLGDGYLRAHLVDIFVPFAMAKQSVWTGVGIIAGWLIAIFTLSYYVRKWITTPVWRWLHRWTLLAYALAVVHTLGSGSDAGSWWMIVLLVAITTPIVFLSTYRFLPRAKRKTALQKA